MFRSLKINYAYIQWQLSLLKMENMTQLVFHNVSKIALPTQIVWKIIWTSMSSPLYDLTIVSLFVVIISTGRILGVLLGNERRRYYVATSLISKAQARNQPCLSTCDGMFSLKARGLDYG